MKNDLFKALLALAFVYTIAGAAEDRPFDFNGFKTVEEAKTTKITSGGSQATSQPIYLGVITGASKNGVLVEEIAPESPAAKAEIQTGDVVTKINNAKVRNQTQFNAAMQKLQPADEATFSIRRGTKQLELVVEPTAISRPLSPRNRNTARRRGVLGIQLAPSSKGAKVRSVYDGSGADKAGMKVGDVIVKMSDKEIANGDALVRGLQSTKPGDKVEFVVQRDEKDITVEVELQGSFGNTRSSRSTREGAYRLAVVCIEYPDQKHNDKVSVEDWEESLFTEGVHNDRNATGQKVYGSMNDYYRELSAGKFGVEGKVFDWVEVSKNRQAYSTGSKSALLVEAVSKLLEREGEDALKDYDGIFFLYAGGRVRTERGGLYWPHRATFSYKRKAWPYFIMQEGGSRMSSISVMCHEFGHMIGLPDLYSKDSRAEGLSVWCAMSNQAGSGRPQHFSAWCKERLGWLKPTVIDPTVKQKLILGQVERSATECYKVLIQSDGSEYLLLENRRRFGFDASLPGEGLLIWRVVNNRPVLEESHGIAGPTGPGSFRDAVPYPSRSNTAFTPLTTPSSSSTTGGGLPVHITNIREHEDGRISFYIGYEFQ